MGSVMVPLHSSSNPMITVVAPPLQIESRSTTDALLNSNSKNIGREQLKGKKAMHAKTQDRTLKPTTVYIELLKWTNYTSTHRTLHRRCYLLVLLSLLSLSSRRLNTLEAAAAPPKEEKQDDAAKELARSARCVSQALPGGTLQMTGTVYLSTKLQQMYDISQEL